MQFVDISNDENNVETKSESEVVVCCIIATKLEEISIDKDVDVVEVNDGMVNMQNVDEDDKIIKCEDNKELFVQEESLKDTSMNIFKSCIESDDYGHIDTMNLKDNTEDVVEVKDKDGLEINYNSYVAENEECFTHPFGAHKEADNASCEKYIHENGVSNDRKSDGDIFEEKCAKILNGADKDRENNKFFANKLSVSDCVGTKKENDEVLAYKLNIEGEETTSVAVCSLNIPMMSVVDDNDEEVTNEAAGIYEISHGEVMVDDDHDDRMQTSISEVCEATSKAKKDKVHCVEVLEPIYDFF